MKEQITTLLNEVEQFATDSKEQIEAFRIKILGSKGVLKDLFAEFKNVPKEQKKEVGQLINELKEKAQEKV
ncbi:MAG: phenylalanine--tRNA ligase subunit alpha, partial [Flavobacteriales bacterium]|nr:phenylalanine--tRNA ligase subunit alpha [Flavobacteriales bacterium]